MVADSKRRATMISLLNTEVLGPIQSAVARGEAILVASETSGVLAMFEPENVEAMRQALAAIQGILAMPQVAMITAEYIPGHSAEPQQIGLEE